MMVLKIVIDTLISPLSMALDTAISDTKQMWNRYYLHSIVALNWNAYFVPWTTFDHWISVKMHWPTARKHNINK